MPGSIRYSCAQARALQFTTTTVWLAKRVQRAAKRSPSSCDGSAMSLGGSTRQCASTQRSGKCACTMATMYPSSLPRASTAVSVCSRALVSCQVWIVHVQSFGMVLGPNGVKGAFTPHLLSFCCTTSQAHNVLLPCRCLYAVVCAGNSARKCIQVLTERRALPQAAVHG